MGNNLDKNKLLSKETNLGSWVLEVTWVYGSAANIYPSKLKSYHIWIGAAYEKAKWIFFMSYVT